MIIVESRSDTIRIGNLVIEKVVEVKTSAAFSLDKRREMWR